MTTAIVVVFFLVYLAFSLPTSPVGCIDGLLIAVPSSPLQIGPGRLSARAIHGSDGAGELPVSELLFLVRGGVLPLYAAPDDDVRRAVTDARSLCSQASAHV